FGARLGGDLGLSTLGTFGGGCLAAAAGGAGGGGVGAAGADDPTFTEIPKRRHWPSTGANNSSKLTCEGTDGQKPAIRIMPFDSISGSTVSCGSITATPERSSLSLRCEAKISASFADVLA